MAKWGRRVMMNLALVLDGGITSGKALIQVRESFKKQLEVGVKHVIYTCK